MSSTPLSAFAQPDGASPTSTAAASERVAESLRQAILSGEIVPGQRVRQEEVAERLSSSRLPVREALRMLEAEGLIEHRANKGARVPRLSMHEVDVVYQMRERLEPLALSESLPHLTDTDLRRLEELQTRIEANTGEGNTGEDKAGDNNSGVADFLALDREFHLLTYAGCQIDTLTAIVNRLWNVTQHYRRAFMALSGPGRMWVVNAEHRLLLDAIQRRDAVDAERYLGGHIRRTRVELDRHPEVFGETTP
ncbi:MAG TPA: GntR family transcriptional regulator [Dermatophilaceae bacterium]|nr:GntR family transcriptional regulator [Dermatophilaceae bacterium]